MNTKKELQDTILGKHKSKMGYTFNNQISFKYKNSENSIYKIIEYIIVN